MLGATFWRGGASKRQKLKFTCMKSLSFKLLFFFVAIIFSATAVARPTKSSAMDKLKWLQMDSAVNIKTDSISQKVVFNADSSVDDVDNELSDEEITALVESTVSTSPSLSKTIMRGIVGVVAITVPFAFVIVLIWLIFRYSTSRNRERNKLIELSIRERSPLPDSFYKSERSYYTGPRRLSSGIIWIGVGIAFISFFACVGSDEMAVLGLIPMFVGVARIVVYFVGKRDAGQD